MDKYVFKAIEYFAKAEATTDPETRIDFNNMARTYLRLGHRRPLVVHGSGTSHEQPQTEINRVNGRNGP